LAQNGKKVGPGKWQAALQFCRKKVQEDQGKEKDVEGPVLLMSTPADLIPDDDSVELDFRELFGIEEANDDDDVEVIHTVTASSEASSLK